VRARDTHRHDEHTGTDPDTLGHAGERHEHGEELESGLLGRLRELTDLVGAGLVGRSRHVEDRGEVIADEPGEPRDRQPDPISLRQVGDWLEKYTFFTSV
jgi:hypothetical protein